jgi:hypothetical protein
MRLIPLQNKTIQINDCGHCPFFEYDSHGGEYHKCKAVLPQTIYVDILGIPKLCPLIQDETTKLTELEDNKKKRRYDHEAKFVGYNYNGVKFKGCETYGDYSQ